MELCTGNWSGVDAHRVAFAVSDLSGSLEKEAGTFSGGKNDIYVAGLRCGVCGGLQTCVDRLKDVRVDKVVTYVAGGTKNGFKRGMRVLWEMRIYEGGEKGPAGVLCAVDANGVDVSLLVEQRVHDRKWQLGGRCSREQMPICVKWRDRTPRTKTAQCCPFHPGAYTRSHGLYALWDPLISALGLCHFITLR